MNNYYSLLTANLPLIPKTVNIERRRGRPKYTKQTIVVPKNLLNNSNAPLNILNAGYKKNIKIANINILNYVRISCKKTKTQIFNNLVIILRDSLIRVISNINNNNLPTTEYSL